MQFFMSFLSCRCEMSELADKEEAEVCREEVEKYDSCWGRCMRVDRAKGEGYKLD